MLTPLICKPLVALTVPTVSVPEVPLSTKERRVFGLASASLMVNVPLVPAVAIVIFGADANRVTGEEADKLTVPEAAIVVAPLIAPAPVMPPLLLLNPPVTDKPPAEMVCKAVKVLA